ncbi:nucleotide-binding protein [Pseudomonas gregormendelii]|uniref:Nucleotide-binding protein n=1 Tax=Pseudomonas gregormendelii TaxID=1628277 RepID=A0ABS3AHB0_9PSED|nr:nucleotide-binding protein [Pseudomonas gregormendelii]MBN3966500.1 nucleotide-binding protein [Pseudomonas gregormendelii]
MFNLLISASRDSWDSGTYELEKGRAIVEYTDVEISERYKDFDENAIQELKSFPCIFAIENEAAESRVGYITNIHSEVSTVTIEFKFDEKIPPLKRGAIEDLREEIGLGKLELYRTHWAVKDEQLFELLLNKGLITNAQLTASQALESPPPPVSAEGEQPFNRSQVFIVHGHDEIAKLEMASFVTALGLEPIILHMQASSGRTIIEKIEHYSNVGFGIVLYTPCDIGYKVGNLNSNYRARQNVVFEHGYLIGKLGRDRVVAVVKGATETPNDISGVVYVSLDDQENWKEELIKEMRSLQYKV